MTCKDVSCPCHDFGNETNPKNICCDKCSSPNPITASRERMVEEMVGRFLQWKLPHDFNPDGGITFEPEFNKEYMAKQGKPPMRHEPTGTNLLTATQAKEMLLLILGDFLPQHEATVREEMARIVENNKRKHFVFECGGAHGGRGCNETFCEDNSKLGPCTSEDAREVRKHNSTIDEIAALIRTTKPNV